jgi:hypothetical protein
MKLPNESKVNLILSDSTLVEISASLDAKGCPEK